MTMRKWWTLRFIACLALSAISESTFTSAYGVETGFSRSEGVNKKKTEADLLGATRRKGNLQMKEDLQVNDLLHIKDGSQVQGSFRSVRLGSEKPSSREIRRGGGRGDNDKEGLQVSLSYRTEVKNHLRQSERNFQHELDRPSNRRSSRRRSGKQKGRKGRYRAAQEHPHAYGKGEREEQSDDSVHGGHVLLPEQKADPHLLNPDGKSNSVKSQKSSEEVAKACSVLSRCENGGQCRFDAQLATERCLCPLGFSGNFCETELVVRYPKLSGLGFVALPVLRGAFREFVITMDFRPDSRHGLLLFSSDHPETRFDFFSVSLVDGRVDFRFDCGTGLAQILSKNSVQLNQWNTLWIHRLDWNGYLRLNDGPEAKGKSKGIFSKMTFRDDVFVGGHMNMTSIQHRTGVSVGFTGCIRSLKINKKNYDMRKGAFVGDALYGLDVAECSGRACDTVKCLNGGTCGPKGADSSLCLCPLGATGDRCQSKIDVLIPSFDGHSSYLQFIGMRRTILSFSEIEIVFRAKDADGLLFYDGYATDATGDFVSVALKNGTVEYRFDLGTGPAIIRSTMPVTLDEWHVIRMIRSGRTGYLQVDNQPQVEGTSTGAFTQLTLTLDLFIGGHRNFDEMAKAADVTKAFKGCIQKVVINERPLKLLDESLKGVNIANCDDHKCLEQPCKNGGQCVPMRDSYKCNCPPGFQSINCEDRTVRSRLRYRYRRAVEEKPISIPMFNGDSFLLYTDQEMIHRTRGQKTEVEMRLKSHSPDGLLFYVGEYDVSPSSDYLAIGLVNGQLQLSYDLGDGESVIVSNETRRLDNGQWHFIRAERSLTRGSLEIDGHLATEVTSAGQLRQLQTDGTILIGGLSDVFRRTRGKYAQGFNGCIVNLTLSGDYDVVELVQSADAVRNVNECVDMTSTGG